MGHAHRHRIDLGQDEKARLTDRLIYWKRDLPTILGVSARTIDRWISAGEFPVADVHISGKPVWRRETIKTWCGAPANA